MVTQIIALYNHSVHFITLILTEVDGLQQDYTGFLSCQQRTGSWSLQWTQAHQYWTAEEWKKTRQCFAGHLTDKTDRRGKSVEMMTTFIQV